MIWSPTHKVPAGGMAVWESPDPSRPPISALPGDTTVMEEQRAGDWVLARTQDGWRGWVDGRQLIPIPRPAAPPEQPDVPAIIPAAEAPGAITSPAPRAARAARTGGVSVRPVRAPKKPQAG
jgi:hypothetical protein